MYYSWNPFTLEPIKLLNRKTTTVILPGYIICINRSEPTLQWVVQTEKYS